MDVTMLQKIQELVDQEVPSEEINRIIHMPEEDFEIITTRISEAFQNLTEGSIHMSEFLSITVQLFPLETWKEYYFMEHEITEEVLETGLTFELVFKHLRIMRCVLPPIYPFIHHLCTTYNLHTSMSLALFTVTEDTLKAETAKGDWFFPDSYVPMDLSRRIQLSSNVKVGVIDTGIDPFHPDLQHIPQSRRKDFTGTRSPVDEVGHGTHCIGILNGRGVIDPRVAGIAPGADAYSLKALGPKGGTLEAIFSALDWGLEEGISIFSMSFGSKYPKEDEQMNLFSRLIEKAISDFDLLICVSAGNEGCTEHGTPVLHSITSPGDCPSAITVGAVDSNSYLAPFSSKGSLQQDSRMCRKPTLCAPGVKVVSCLASTHQVLSEYQKHYVGMSGTSMATPLVAGLCCLLRNSIFDNQEIINTLQGACKVPLDQKGRPYSQLYEVGWGVPDTHAIAKRLGFRAASVQRRCDWSGVPIPSGAQLGRDYLLCEDQPHAYISMDAFMKGSHHSDYCPLSKGGLSRKSVLLEEVHKRELAIQHFRANAERLGLLGTFEVKSRSSLVSLPVVSYVRQVLTGSTLRKRRSNALYALCFEPEGVKLLPQSEETCIAFIPPVSLSSKFFQREHMRWCTLCEQQGYWIVSDASPLGADSQGELLGDLFWLEIPEHRKKRCLAMMRQEHLQPIRRSLPQELVSTIREEFGDKFLVQQTFPGFKILTEKDDLIIRAL